MAAYPIELYSNIPRSRYDWAPRVTCGMAWANPVTSTAMFRVELYDALVAGGTGNIWFAHRALPGAWNEPGPLFDESGVLAKEVMQLVPALLGPEVLRNPSAGVAAQPTLVAVAGVTQEGTQALVHAVARREASGCVHLILVNQHNGPVQASVGFALGTPGIFSTHGQAAFGLVPFEKSQPQYTRRVSVRNGTLREWLPAWGTQVLRFNGTSSCAAPLPESATNLVANPSFESSAGYTAAPDGWGCGITSASQDRMCFADASSARHGRRSGRFVSGANFGTLRIEVPASIPANSSTYNFFAWVRGDCDGQVISLKIITHELGDETAWLGSKSSSYHQPVATSEQEAATVRTDTTWVRLSAQSVSLRGGDFLAFAVVKPGAIWLDEVVLEAA